MKINIQLLIPDHLNQEDKTRSKARIFAFAGLAVWFMGIIMLLLYLTIIATPLSNLVATAAMTLLITVLLWYFKTYGNIVLASNVLMSLGLFALNVSIIETGGINSMDMIWIMIFPCGGFLLIDNKAGLTWGILSLVNALTFLIIDLSAPSLLPTPKPDSIYNFVSVFLCMSIVTFTIYYYVSQNKLYSLVLAQKNEKLLQTQEEILNQNQLLQQNQEEIATQNEELLQNQEEIIAQRDFIELKNKVLEKREQLIHSSIKAAQVIQAAILPSEQKMNNLLGDYFLIYRPRDVVSGDFYWLNKIDGVVYLATVDCTGHGVPGAFVSLIGNTLLDKIIRLRKITDPATILQQLHNDIYVTLRQEETENNYGMDMSLLAFTCDDTHCHIQFCGAKNSMYYYNPDAKELNIIKGDRKSIGGFQPDSIHFTTQKMSMPKGWLIFMGSDGIEDQNNTRRKRFGTKRIKENLLATIDQPMLQQKENMENAIDNYMVDTTQRDDMLLIGVRL